MKLFLPKICFASKCTLPKKNLGHKKFSIFFSGNNLASIFFGNFFLLCLEFFPPPICICFSNLHLCCHVVFVSLYCICVAMLYLCCQFVLVSPCSIFSLNFFFVCNFFYVEKIYTRECLFGPKVCQKNFPLKKKKISEYFLPG